jgi:hypothetical protein
MEGVGHLLSYDESALLREALHALRFDVWEYFGDGEYPSHRAEKDEAEGRVAALVSAWSDDDLAAAVERNEMYLTRWVPERLQDASTPEEIARLAAFADLQWLIEDSRAALRLDALGPPRADQPLALALPEIHAALSRDGLLRIRGDNVTDAGGSLQVFRHGSHALYPHPDLQPLRELLWVLADLADDPNLAVFVALDPYRVGALADVQYALLADQWSGIELAPGNLDSLDAHDVGVSSFHAAVNRSEALDFFHPLVATTCDWTARRDDATDPVKRLYIREFVPPTNARGERLVAVRNRELHTERDTIDRVFTHVDGKIRRYPTETYAVDHDQPRGDPGPPSHSRKLWRVDGQMTDAQWAELVGLHFRGNELVPEHFRTVFPDMSAYT